MSLSKLQEAQLPQRNSWLTDRANWSCRTHRSRCRPTTV